MPTEFESKINVFYRDPEGEKHIIVKHIWENKNRIVKSASIRYPNDVKFPIKSSRCWVIPSEWKFESKDWDYLRQEIIKPPERFNVPDKTKLKLCYKDLAGEKHIVVKRIYGKMEKSTEQWIVKAVRFTYTDGVNLPLQDYHSLIVPRCWELLRCATETSTPCA